MGVAPNFALYRGMMYFLIRLAVIGITFVLPVVIVWFWTKRPIIALVVASFLMLLALILPKVLVTLQALVIYGTGDPQLLAGGISEAVVTGILFMIVGVPVLAVIQWVSRQSQKSKLTKPDVDKAFL